VCRAWRRGGARAPWRRSVGGGGGRTAASWLPGGHAAAPSRRLAAGGLHSCPVEEVGRGVVVEQGRTPTAAAGGTGGPHDRPRAGAGDGGPHCRPAVFLARTSQLDNP
jgi:hypothetical protein